MNALVRVWKDRSIGVKLIVLAVVAAIGLGATGVAGYRALKSLRSSSDEMATIAGMQVMWSGADMAHDATHADVLQLIVNLLAAGQGSTDTDNTAPLEDMKANQAVLTKAVATIKQAAKVKGVSKEQQGHIDASEQAVNTYIAAANKIADDVANDPNALLEDFNAFTAAFNTAADTLPLVEVDLDGFMKASEQSIKDTQKSATISIVIYASAALLILVAVAWAVRRAVVTPLRVVERALNGMAEGDLTIAAEVDAKDEVGRMAATLGRAQAGVRDAIAALARSATQVSDSSQHLSQATAQISVAAEQVTAQAGAAAAASGQISGGLQTVAAGSEEMGASIGEIARNATSAANVAAEAVEVASSTNKAMVELSESSIEIGKVVNVITSIAEQTNMLALNATIEAARAGEAGKGFAVVAGEVKDLAQETAEATAEITAKVGQIQGKAEEAVAAIAQISGIIDRINDYQGTIASAVEEQTATTAEINKNMSQAATGAAEISTNVDGVASAARLTSENVSSVQSSADELAQLSTELRGLVERFTV